jgi:hypothetical protein
MNLIDITLQQLDGLNIDDLTKYIDDLKLNRKDVENKIAHLNLRYRKEEYDYGSEESIRYGRLKAVHASISVRINVAKRLRKEQSEKELEIKKSEKLLITTTRLEQIENVNELKRELELKKSRLCEVTQKRDARIAKMQKNFEDELETKVFCRRLLVHLIPMLNDEQGVEFDRFVKCLLVDKDIESPSESLKDMLEYLEKIRSQ